MLDCEFRHREVVDVRGGQAGSDTDCRGGNETVGLMQGHASLGELTAPRARPHPLRDTKGGDTEPAEQPAHNAVF